MTDYLAIVRKLDFIDLFKYGQFIINNAVPFDGKITSHSDDDKLFDALTSKMNMYEYSFEYLIIHFKTECCEEKSVVVDIEKVCNVYTFDEEAKNEMSISFDPRIQLYVSPWADKFLKLQQELSIKQSIRGIKNLWAIFDLPESDLLKCESIITQDIVQEVFRELYAYERPSGEKSIWVYLLRYERHSYYPQDMTGFFCDFVHVFVSFLEKREVGDKEVELTKIYLSLMECQGKKAKFMNLLKIVEASPLSERSELASRCKLAIAAPLFLYLKHQFGDGIKYKADEKTINYAKKIGGFECSVAIYLLGIVLGHDKTYDAFYETVQLSLFKKPAVKEKGLQNSGGKKRFLSQSPKASEKNTSDKVKNVGKTYENNKTTTIIPTEEYQNKESAYQKELPFMDNESNGPQLPISWVRKKRKNEKADIRPVLSQEDYSKYKQQGYTEVERFYSSVITAIKGWGYDPTEEKARLKKRKKK